ncbi:MFS transporter [Thalassobaculum fulvum]|uniref:MFS transporter n=1 Tax=Thalassobaculum fulvum TaxID=1633335 RepID=A0A919CP73_9PROT|nr:MFS transporter [Thalassobaculum fulvum]GHD48975.1 MFS transporter [Thalassobaculum fulvum]
MLRPQVSGGGLAAFGVLALCFVMNALARGAGETYAVFLLPIGEETGWDRGALTSAYSIYMAANGLASPFVGLAFDRFGPRVLYVLGLLALGGGFLLAGSMSSLWELYLSVGLMAGLGIASLGMIPASALISRWFDKRLATAMAVASTGLGTGTLVLVPVTQLLIQQDGWRAAYAWLGGGVLVAALPVALLPWRAIGRGQVADRRTAPGPENGSGLLRAMRGRPFWALFLVFFLTAVAVFSVSLQSVAYLVEQGFSPLEAAGAFGFTGVLSIVGMLATGTAADRYGNRVTATVSYLCTFTGVAALFAMQAVPAFALVVVFVVFFGVSMGARGPVVSTIAATLFAGRGLGVIYGTITTGQGLGAAAGSWLAGYLHDLTGGYNAGFLLSAVFVATGVALFWTVPELAARRSAPR